jgi:flagellar biosynthetic protein FliO
MKRHLKVLAVAVMFQGRVLSAFGNITETTPSADSESSAWYTLVVPLVLVLAAAAAATFFLRRWQGNIVRRDGPMQLVHVLSVGPRERLALVKVGERHLVVGITPSHVSRIAELYDIQHAQSGASPAQNDDGV